MKKVCSNCEFKNLCGCPVIDHDIVGEVETCSSWSISLKAYIRQEQEKERKRQRAITGGAEKSSRVRRVRA